MVLAIKILIGLIVLGFILWPCVGKKEAEEAALPQEKDLHLLLEQKEQTYAAIKELDFDYQMDKLSEEDYQELSREYKQKAVAVLQQIDELSGSLKVGTKASG